MKKIIYSIIAVPVILISLYFSINNDNNKKEMKEAGIEFYVGTYTDNESEGIYKYLLMNDGNLQLVGLVAKTENPSFLTKSDNNKYLLAVNENNSGTVESFQINKDDLKFINRQPSGGAHPCFVTTNNGNVLVANYTGGNVGYLKLNVKGELSSLLDVQQHFGKDNNDNQNSPHAHSAWFDGNNQNIISVDLGTNELIFSTIDSEREKLIPLAQNKLEMNPNAGPRHLAIHPRNKWIYVINELNSTVSLIKKDKNKYVLGSSYSTLPQNWSEKTSCADIHISDDGKFLYASNRGHNSIAIYSIMKNGKLELIGHESTRGNWPRNFSLSPNNDFLLVANQHTNNIVSFKRDSNSGKLNYISEIKAPAPVCILF